MMMQIVCVCVCVCVCVVFFAISCIEKLVDMTRSAMNPRPCVLQVLCYDFSSSSAPAS